MPFKYLKIAVLFQTKGNLMSLKVVILCVSLLFVACNAEEKPVKVLNNKHQFIIHVCDIRYNGTSLTLGDPVADWVRVLGPYDRKVRLANDIYVWDKIGLQVFSRWDKARVLSIDFMFEHKESVYEHALRLRESQKDKKYLADMVSARPKQYFHNALKLDGVLIDKNINFEDINDARIRYARETADKELLKEVKMFQRSYTPVRYAYERNCSNGQRYGFLMMLISSKKPHLLGTLTITGDE